ncbi:carbohydrate sulfotransferase 11-like isoform X2 [Haliotis asinina]|uniref:carbohydrate sulfotransferase 11-like isoform X2 n=1 Tax=Haliotis asinina TaxID=109174 RepID=UPI003531C351
MEYSSLKHVSMRIVSLVFGLWRRETRKYYAVTVLLIFMVAGFNVTSIFHQVHQTRQEPALPKDFQESRVVKMSVDQIYKERLQYVKSECRHSNKGSVSKIFRHDKLHIAYCPVAKIGSTFWKRVFVFLHNDTGTFSVKTPFEIPRAVVHYGKKNKTQISPLDEYTKRTIYGNYTRFMFARDPYSRLWSAYLDKFFLPDFWRSFALHITRQRYDPTFEARKCGSDVSFSEFLEYVVSLLPENMNEHWQPIQYKCDPCQFKPNIIGKQETFGDDSRYILQGIGQEWIMNAFDHDAHVEEELSMLIDYNFALITKSRFYRNCTSRADIVRRLWQVFQLNGYLPIEETAESVVKKLSNTFLDRDIFKRYVLEVYRRTTVEERRALKHQRKEAIVGAYKTVPLTLIKKITEIFLNDFETFGYDTAPPNKRDT